MGWSYRRSVKLGPVRLNFSKSGVGASVGIKGLRIGTGPRGTHLTASGGGFQYRQRIGGAAPAPPVSSAQAPAPTYAAPEAPGLLKWLLAIFLVGWIVKCAADRPARSAAVAPVAAVPAPAAQPVAAPAQPKRKQAHAKPQKPAWLKAVKAVPPPDPGE